MAFKSGILFLTLLVGSLGASVGVEQLLGVRSQESRPANAATLAPAAVVTTAEVSGPGAAGPAVIPVVESHEDLFYHTDPAARIVGGTPAATGSAPHMVALTTGTWTTSFMCGASLLTTRTVLTAAHCIEAATSWGTLISSLRGRAGTNQWNSGGVEFAFSHGINHEQYDSWNIKHDIGLLITATPVPLSATIQLVSLSFNHIPGGLDAKASGWGRIRSGGAISTNLLELTMKTMDGDQCVRQMPYFVDPQIELCTIHSPGFGMCNGDSGSALMDVATNQQIGIVSWGIPCATAAPDLFVRVSAYRDWLARHTV